MFSTQVFDIKGVWFVLLLLCLSMYPAFGEEMKAEELYKKSVPSVMTLTVSKKDGNTAIGTSFLISANGIAVTAWHVVRDATKVEAKFSNGEVFDVSGLIDRDVKRDLALIKVKVYGKVGLKGDENDPTVGAKAYIIGAPKGLEFSISDGLINQLQILDGMTYYQFSCAASPGNSGGPLLNSEGAAIGIVSWQIKDGQNLNFAIPMKYALGLDNTLPTKPWEDVKPEVSSVHDVNSDADIDKVLANALVVDLDSAGIGTYCFQLMTKPLFIERKNLFGVPIERIWITSCVPSIVYQQEKRVQQAKFDVDRIVTDGSRDKAKKVLTDHLLHWMDFYRLAISGFELAIKSNGWSPDANSSASKARACVPIDINNIDIYSDLCKSKTFVDNIPIDYQSFLNVLSNDPGLRLGSAIYSLNPTCLLVVGNDTFASTLGFQDGDTILSAGKQEFKSLDSFKRYVKNNLGNNTDITISRNGNQKVLTIHIPKEIPEKYLKK